MPICGSNGRPAESSQENREALRAALAPEPARGFGCPADSGRIPLRSGLMARRYRRDPTERIHLYGPPEANPWWRRPYFLDPPKKSVRQGGHFYVFSVGK